MRCHKLFIVCLFATFFSVNLCLDVQDNEVLEYGNGRQGPFVEWILGLLGPAWRPTTPKPQVDTTPATTTAAPQRDDCKECVCGLTNKNKRIVGGQETEVNQYSWMAMLTYNKRFYCGATLINDRFVVTASHCLHGFNKDYIMVRLLKHNRKMNETDRIHRKAKNVITHPNYNTLNYNNDIALIELDEPVEISERLRPACLPTPGKSFSGENAIVTGWGAIREGGPTSDTLQEVQVPVMSNSECRKSKYGERRITDNMLCAGYKDGGKDSCQGDSGGPLHVIQNGQHQLAGVVSWGEGCAKGGYPGVYARVNRYGTWIRSLTKEACYCNQILK